ncbi:GDSL-type esterase/lipase family protein [Ruminococcus sp.]|uniref:GDSL-type esterase/lipase family protein n=1 Tax=Ruminococcus sp. TaxID=41978 RepID=UPI0025F97E50|nr:GDSL-type esterase/lipase family protein [Ruminococcus sp.]MDD7556728.1 GDSL-type esterase/lipase family protein [Ruminococcus sp.]MDY4964356.1 GDSL-type esterase/lipase family protein [Ruminococcus callidus]
MTDKEMKIARYREANKSAVKGQVVFAGSSLMEMFPIRKLQQEKGDDRMIYNRGVGGFLSGELLAVIDVCVTQLLPAKVFINIGTNDLSWSSIPICELMDRYDQILTAIEDAVPGVRIYLMAYYPVNEAAASPEMRDCLKIRTNEKISAANEEVKKLAAKHGQRYIDVNDKLRDEQGRLRAEYTIEGMHINEAGYRAIYDDIMAYVRE